jgi:hypothetical protein
LIRCRKWARGARHHSVYAPPIRMQVGDDEYILTT